MFCAFYGKSYNAFYDNHLISPQLLDILFRHKNCIMFLDVLGVFFGFVFLFLLFFFFLLGWRSLNGIQYFPFLTLFIHLFFILGMCIRKEACLFVSLHFCP